MQSGYYYFKVDGEIRYDFRQPFTCVDSLICNIIECGTQDTMSERSFEEVVAFEKPEIWTDAYYCDSNMHPAMRTTPPSPPSDPAINNNNDWQRKI